MSINKEKMSKYIQLNGGMNDIAIIEKELTILKYHMTKEDFLQSEYVESLYNQVQEIALNMTKI